MLENSGLVFEKVTEDSVVIKHQANEELSAAELDALLEEIVVTGSHIRGIGIPVGSNLKIITREDIELSGYATTQQLIASLPQNFGGGASEDTRFGDARANFSGASGVNLKGLGSESA